MCTTVLPEKHKIDRHKNVLNKSIKIKNTNPENNKTPSKCIFEKADPDFLFSGRNECNKTATLDVASPVPLFIVITNNENRLPKNRLNIEYSFLTGRVKLPHSEVSCTYSTLNWLFQGHELD